VKELVPPPVAVDDALVNDDALIDEELRQMREDFNKTFSALKSDLSKSLPDSIMFSGQSSPNQQTTTV